jgi:hypothetical protein
MAKRNSTPLDQLRDRIVAQVAPERTFKALYYGWAASDPIRGVYLGQYFQRFPRSVATSRVYPAVITPFGIITTLNAGENLVHQLKPVPVGSLVVIYNLGKDRFLVKSMPWKALKTLQ